MLRVDASFGKHDDKCECREWNEHRIRRHGDREGPGERYENRPDPEWLRRPLHRNEHRGDGPRTDDDGPHQVAVDVVERRKDCDADRDDRTDEHAEERRADTRFRLLERDPSGGHHSLLTMLARRSAITRPATVHSGATAPLAAGE